MYPLAQTQRYTTFCEPIVDPAAQFKTPEKKNVPLQIIAVSPIHSNHPSRDNDIIAFLRRKSKEIFPDPAEEKQRSSRILRHTIFLQ
jgi:hypothetical protein